VGDNDTRTRRRLRGNAGTKNGGKKSYLSYNVGVGAFLEEGAVFSLQRVPQIVKRGTCFAKGKTG